MLSDAKASDDLGPAFGATLTAREISYLMAHEYARSAEDVVWRRNKLGLRLDAGQIAARETWMQAQAA